MTEPWRYSAYTSHVRDGDTVVVRCGVAPDLEATYVVRLIGVDAPERKGETKPAGDAAKAFVEARLFVAGAVLGYAAGANEMAAVPIEVGLSGRKDVYGRHLGSVYVGGISLADLLVQSGHGVPRDYGSHLAALAAED